LKKWIFLLIIVLAATGCSNEKNVSEKTDQSTMSGYIIDKKEQMILVVENVTEEDVKTKSVKELLQLQPPAIWFTGVDTNLYENLQIGEQVKVKIDGGVFLSYPGKATAEEIIRHKQ
jgi:uncharacterized protein YcfL